MSNTLSIDKRLSSQMANMSFVCACLIVLLHCTPAPAVGSWSWWVCHLLGREGACIVAVPYFFFAAGYFLMGKLLSPEKSLAQAWKEEVSKRVFSLIIPMLIWMAIYYIKNYALWSLKTTMFHSAAEPGAWTLPLGVQIIRFVGLHPFIDIGVFWFVRCLFALVVVSPLLLLAARRWRMLLAMLMVIFAGFLWLDGQHLGWNFYFFFDRYITIRGTLWFFIGMVARQEGWTLVRGKMDALGFIAIGFFLLMAKNILDLCQLGSYMNLGEALAVPFLMFGLLSLLPDNKFPQCLVGNAFAIFLMHNIFLSLVAMALMVAKLQDNPGLQVPIMVIRLVVAVGVSIAAAEAIRRFLPRCASLAFGGR